MSFKVTHLSKHMLKAYMDWFAENDFPQMHILVKGSAVQGTLFQNDVAKHGIVLNVSALATRNMQFHDNHFTFDTRRLGESVAISIRYDELIAVHLPVNETTKVGMDLDPLEHCWSKYPELRPSEYFIGVGEVEKPKPTVADRARFGVINGGKS